MSKMTNIYLISSIGTSLNKGVLKDFSFFSFLFFRACAGEGWTLRCKQRELTPKNRAHLLVSSFFLFAVLVELVEEVVESFEANEDHQGGGSGQDVHATATGKTNGRHDP